MTRANGFISLFTGVLVAFLAGAAFRLSFDVLRDLAAANGVAAGMAWLYPAIIDGAIIVFSLSVLQASLNQRRTRYPWSLVVLFTLLSIALNVVHAQRAFLPRVLAAVPPVALFLSFELLMGQVKGMVEQAALWQRWQQLETAVRERTAAMEKLDADLDKLAAKKVALLDELKALRRDVRTEKASDTGSLERARAVRAAAKTEAMATLLDYLANHPHATLSDMAAVIGRSKSTAGAYVSELRAAGRLYKNGQGWEVVRGG